MEKLTFKQLTRNKLKDIFGLVLVSKHSSMDFWLEKAKHQTINDYETETLTRLQNKLIKRCSSWNEFELSEWFIGPLINLIDYETDDNSLFAFHDISAEVNNYELTGKPDVMFARGIDEPQIPYFFFHEYKRQTDPDGNPQTQLLGAMLAGQGLNQNTKTIYGMYVIGKSWTFITLEQKYWCETKAYSSENEQIYDIFKILKTLKEII